MNFTDIECVIAVAEEASFTKAAKRLFISQSAVSQSVSKLEKELGLSLFLRSNNTVHPTEACREFVKHGRTILKNYTLLNEKMQKMALGASHRLRIGTASFFFKFLKYHTEMLNKHSAFDFDFEIIEETAANIERMVASGQVDFCFTRFPLVNKALNYEALFTETVLLAVPINHPINLKHPVPNDGSFPEIDLSEVQNESFVMINNPRVTPLCMQMCKDAGFVPNISLRTMAWEHVYAYIAAGNAVGFISCLHINDSHEAIRFYKIKSGKAQLQHVVAYINKNVLPPNALKYISELRRYIEERLPI